MNAGALESIRAKLALGSVIPYLGPGVLSMEEGSSNLPATQAVLAGCLTAKSNVPFKLKTNLGAAAQFIENFKHRRTVTAAMTEALRLEAKPAELHRFLRNLPKLPLIVHTWYDDLPQKTLKSRASWGMVQGVSQAEHFGNWFHYFSSEGNRIEPEGAKEADTWETVLYQPLGSVWPAQNYLVSDSDFVEVLTEIDIQTPIPQQVQRLREGRSFLFLGCRFQTQMERQFARQIIKRSSDKHWAIFPESVTRNEERFLEEANIERVDITLSEFVREIGSERVVS